MDPGWSVPERFPCRRIRRVVSRMARTSGFQRQGPVGRRWRSVCRCLVVRAIRRLQFPGERRRNFFGGTPVKFSARRFRRLFCAIQLVRLLATVVPLVVCAHSSRTCQTEECIRHMINCVLLLQAICVIALQIREHWGEAQMNQLMDDCEFHIMEHFG